MHNLLDGKATSLAIEAELTKAVQDRIANDMKRPHLAAVLVGDNPASRAYVGHKVKACARVGFESTLVEKPLDIEKVLHSLLLAFVSSKMELKTFLQQSGTECKEAKQKSKVQTSEKDVSEVQQLSSLGTAWANKLNQWLELHPDAEGKKPTSVDKGKGARRRRYTVISLPGDLTKL